MLESECLNYVASSGDEVCGLIINGNRLWRCCNSHPDPASNFRIDDREWLEAEAAGEITAVFHSHPEPKLV
ncbi:tail protein, partial [Pantoea rodasii]